MSRLGNVGGRLYRGEVSVNFVGRQKLWYAISGVILVVSVVALVTFGLNFSVDFKGGSVFQFPAGKASISQVRSTVASAGGGQDALVQHIAPLNGGPARWQVQTHKLGGFEQVNKIQDAISHRFGIPVSKISTSFVGATWGSQISQKALQALIAFLIVVVIYLSIAFEWKMAASALIALAHDIVITVGVYALLRFQVSPASVIGLLTILGYSLYDTVVVFDKVRENTAGLLGSARSTYSDAANHALNQTLVRSINTSVVALLPVAGILFIGAGLLGAGELKDLALVLFVGMLSGTYSSIFIATPVLADLKEREPQYRALAKRVQQRAAGGRKAAAKAARATVGARGQGDPRGRGTGADGGFSQDPDGPGEPAGADAAAGDAGAGEAEPAVPAGRASSGSSPSRPSRPPGQRQQPRRNQARRRPSGKKRRR